MAVVDYDDGIPCVGRLDAELCRSDGLLRCGEHGAQLAVGLKNGVFHLGDIVYPLAAQLLGELIEREAVPAHFALDDAAVFYEYARPPADHAAKARALHDEPGYYQLAAQQHCDGDEPVGERYPYVLERVCREVGDQYGDDELRQLQFAQLPLSHQAQRHGYRQEHDDRAYKDYCQHYHLGNSISQISAEMRCFYEIY